MNEILKLWDLPESSVYIKIRSPLREEFFSYLASNFGGYRVLGKKLKMTTASVFKKKTGKYFTSLRLIKKLLDMCPIDLRYSFKERIENNVEEIKAQSSSNSIINPKFPLEFSQYLARIAGHLIGDGGVKNDNIVHYTGNCIFLLDEFRNDIIDVIGHTKCGEYCHRRKEDKTIWFSGIVGIILKNFFKDCGSNFKIVPKLILDSDEKSKLLFLRSLFDDESHVNMSAKTIMFKMSNISVIKIIKSLLEDFDIVTGKIGKTRNSEDEKFRYYFYISNKTNLDKFNKLIGFTDPEKKSSLNSLIQEYVRK